MTVLYTVFATIGVIAYLIIGWLVLNLDTLGGGALSKKIPPAFIILLWGPLFILGLLVEIWEDWFTVRK